MDSDVLFDIQVSGLLGRHQFTTDPAPVVAELRALGLDELVVRTVGHWVGYYGAEHTRTLCEALLAAYPAAQDWVADGHARRTVAQHGTTGF